MCSVFRVVFAKKDMSRGKFKLNKLLLQTLKEPNICIFIYIKQSKYFYCNKDLQQLNELVLFMFRVLSSEQ